MTQPFDEADEAAAEQAIQRARIRSGQFHDEYIKPTARGDRAPIAEGCQCRTPMPNKTPNGYQCRRCKQPLRTDPDGNPYRRIRGDLDTPDQVAARKVLEVAELSKEEMRGLVSQLPPEQQRRLYALPKKRFDKVARKMIRLHLITRDVPPPSPGPNTQRRLDRKARSFAEIVDQIAEQR